jgi:hypothetical protein
MNGTMRTESGELDLELCDGYSELETDTLKEMVKVALERGYVDDADWRGVCRLYSLLDISDKEIATG